jgi:eukaryotic-like serine/threonine-protein kinase
VVAPRRTPRPVPAAVAPAVAAASPERLLPVRQVGSLPSPAAVETAPSPPAREPVVLAADPAPAVGHLQIGVAPWAAVSLDGVRVGTTPLAPLPLPPGTYTARLEHPDFKPLLRKVTIRAGQTTPLRLDLRQDAIRNQ